MVGRQLHDKGSRTPRQRLELFQNHAGHHHSPHANKESGGGNQGRIAEHCTSEQADDGHFCAAGDESRGHHRDPPVPVLLNGPGSQNAWYAAAGGHQHGDNGLAGQTEFPENPVHDEGHPGHIAHVLQDGQQEGKHQNLGHKAQHRANACQNTVHHQAIQPVTDLQRCQSASQQVGQPLTEQHFVGPVGSHGADGEREVPHGDGVHQKHHPGENGQGQNPVRDNPVNFIGQGQSVLFLLPGHRPGHHIADVSVALIRHNGLSIVIQLPFAVPDVFFQMGQQLLVQIQFIAHPLVPFEQLDGVPAQIIAGNLALDGFFNVGQGMLHAAAEYMGHIHMGVMPCQFHRFPGGLLAAQALQGADFQTGAAQSPAQFIQIQSVPVFPHQIDHIHGHHHRMAQLDQLGGQVEVTLNVGAVDDVQNGVWMLIDQIAPGHHFLRGVGRQGINARKVLNDHLRVPLPGALFLLHRHAGPVAHILVGAGENVEQCGFSAVGIARQGNFNAHR